MIPDLASYSLGRVLVGHELNGELALLPDPWRPMAEHLVRLDPGLRAAAFDAMLAARPDRDDLLMSLANFNPTGPPPARDARSYATLADVARIISAQGWLWPGWTSIGVFNTLASDPGIGKTRFALDLSRRLYFQLPWPDGQPNTLPAGTRTLWVQGDRNFGELLQAAHDFGLPDDAVVLGSPPDDPFGSLCLDEPENLRDLELRIVESRVAMVVIDTVGMCTERNLTRTDESCAFFAPIMELCARVNVAVIGVTHLSASKNPLGRRIAEKARVLIKMTQPEPINQPHRRRLWVDKSAVLKPPALGVTMGTCGNEYDFDPPAEPGAEPRKSGPMPVQSEKCTEWLKTQLASGPAKVSDLRTAAEAAGFSVDTVYRVAKALPVLPFKSERATYWKHSEPPQGSAF